MLHFTGYRQNGINKLSSNIFVIELATILTWNFEPSTFRLCVILAPYVGRFMTLKLNVDHSI